MNGYINGKVEVWYGDVPPNNLNVLWQKRIVDNGFEKTVMYEYDTESSTWQVHNKIELDKKLNSEGVGDIVTRDASEFSLVNHNHNLNDLLEKSYNSLTEKPTIPSIDGLATIEQVNAISTGLIYQNPVQTFNDLEVTYPSAVQGWASMVINEGVIYSFNGSLPWRSTGLTSFPADVVVKDDLIPINQKLTKSIDLAWTSGKYISINGVVDNENYECTLDYYPVVSGQKFQCNIESTGIGDIVAIYDMNKQFLNSEDGVDFELTIIQDGYVRFSNRKLSHANKNIFIVDSSYKSLEEITSSVDLFSILAPNVQYDLPLVWTDGKYIMVNGIGSDANYQGTLDYYRVFAGQKLQCNISVTGSGDVVALYDENKTFVESKSGTNFEINIEYDGFIRFSNHKLSVNNPVVTNVSEKYVELVSKSNILNNLTANTASKNSFNRIAKPNELFTFIPSTSNVDFRYCGKLDNTKRYLSVSFDDFRSSDFSWVIPLFNKYGFKSTFNRVNSGIPSDLDLSKYSAIINFGHEIGDHTIAHQMYPYYSPLFNGQNPLNIDGDQVEFPSNNDMRINRGDGKNVFGKELTNIVDLGYDAPVFGVSWENLSDIQCQQIRDTFSLYKDATLLPIMDSLSNDLLGTTGSSFGSWNGTKYTGGIFTDCKTSANHEVWEKICLIQFLYYKKYFGMNFDFAQWSLPGSRNSYLYFEENGKYYYDRSKTQFANDLGKLQSSYITDNAGLLKTRSWIDILREFGYKMTHDALFPGRSDGNEMTEFSHHLIINAGFSKKDALIYPTERTIPWYDYTAYNEAFFDGESNYAEKMYNHRISGESAFYNAIENIRNKTANGIIAGCTWDSLDVFSEKIYWEEILRYCKSAGIEVITKSQAFDIAFNHKLQNGNLIYNPELKNTVLEFIPNAITSNTPDGYYGDCSLEVDVNTNENVLHADYVSNNCYYTHYGVPNGNIEFSCNVKGSGNIWIFAIRNNTNIGGESDLLGSITINEATYSNKNISFFIKNESIEEYNGINEGYGNKICGIKIVYNGDIFVKNISLIKN